MVENALRHVPYGIWASAQRQGIETLRGVLIQVMRIHDGGADDVLSTTARHRSSLVAEVSRRLRLFNQSLVALGAAGKQSSMPIGHSDERS